MSAEIMPFPWRHGNPSDPTVRMIQQAFAERGDPMDEDEARTFTREFMVELDRLRRMRPK